MNCLYYCNVGGGALPRGHGYSRHKPCSNSTHLLFELEEVEDEEGVGEGPEAAPSEDEIGGLLRLVGLVGLEGIDCRMRWTEMQESPWRQLPAFSQS